MARYTEDRTIQLLAGRAERMLREYAAEPAMKARLKNLAKKAMGRSVPERDVIFWPAGMLLLGLLEAGQIDVCRAYLDAWIAEGTQVRHTDDALTGYVLVRLYEACGEPSYKDAADVIYQYLLDARKDNKGSIVYNPARDNAWIYADGVGQTVMFLSHYGTTFRVVEALALAALQISRFSQYGMDAATGLPYHGYEAGARIKYGVIGWGRAVGWLLLGTSQYMVDCEARKQMAGSEAPDAGDDMPHGDAWFGVTDCARDAAALTFHRELLAHVLQYARQDGTFSWLLPAAEGPQDSSATGMIAYALVRTLRAAMQNDGDASGSGRDPEMVAGREAEGTGENENRIADLAEVLADFINGDRVYGCSAECFDFGQYRQQYGCYPWGQGAVLAALAIS